MNEYCAGGRAVVGAHDTLAALSHGQVAELYLRASLEEKHAGEEEFGRGLINESQKQSVMNGGDSTLAVEVTNELVTREANESEHHFH